jgi:hypothetical protein
MMKETIEEIAVRCSDPHTRQLCVSTLQLVAESEGRAAVRVAEASKQFIARCTNETHN